MPVETLHPDTTGLQLDFVYGYHGSRCRDNLFYTKSDEIVYHIAGVGIVYNPKTHSQRFFLGHTDDIISLTVHPNGKYVATGQIGKEPHICVWDATTMETVSLLKGFHTRGISSMGFSNDGKYLVSVGLDDDHDMALWEWQAGRLVSHEKTSKERVFDIQLSPYAPIAVTSGFYKYSGNTMTQKRGVFGNTSGDIPTILCIAFGHEDGLTYTGTLNGEILVFKDNQLIKTMKCHKGPIYAICPFEAGFFSGGKDGILKIWDKEWKNIHNVNISQYQIKSLAYKPGKILVGTKTSDILEVEFQTDNFKVTPLIEGHGEGELWGSATSPTSEHFVTAGDDKQVKLWSSETRKCLWSKMTTVEARSCGFSPDGKSIAVGFLDGSFLLLSTKDGSEILRKKDRKEEVSVVKYSPDGKYLAIGTHDNFVDVYDAARYSKVGTLTGNSSFITHLDWSVDCTLVRTNSGAYEELYYEVPSCKRLIKKPAVDWASWTCVLGDNVAGIWPAYSDKTDVNTLDKAKNSPVIVTGDDFGCVKLFKYPAPKGTIFKKYTGHSAHVTSTRFTNDNRFVISTGGGDQAVFQWKVVGGVPTEVSSDAEVPVHFDSDIEREKEVDYERKEKPVVESDDELPTITLETGDSLKAGRPSLTYRHVNKPRGAVETGKSLSGYVDPTVEPNNDLSLEFVFGYRGFDTRHNIHYNSEGNVVYHTAATGIVYSKKDHAQKFFQCHNDDIIALSLHPNGKTVASSQVGKDPMICVWDSVTMEKYATLKGFHERGVNCLDFSPDGSQLLSVGLDDKHSICVWSWAKGGKVASGAGSQSKIMAAQFNPYKPGEFVTVGEKHVAFWSIAGNGLVSKKGVFGKNGSPETFVSIAFSKNFTYTGCATGEIYQWQQNNLVQVIKAHTGPAFDLCAVNEGFASGGKDGIIKIYDSEFKSTKEIKVGKSVIRSISHSSANKSLIVGTAQGSILEVNLENSSSATLLEGHALGELWGLAAHPNQLIFATASDDLSVKIWDGMAHKLLLSKNVEKRARSVAWHPDGRQLAVGFGNGGVSILGYNATSLEEIVSFKHRAEEISDLKFSPNGKYLAVGSHDNFVDIYETLKDYTRVGRCSGMSSFVTHVDWAADSELLCVNSGAYEHLFFKAPKGSQVMVPTNNIQNIQWETFTGILGSFVQGIWPKYSDGTDINSVDRSHSGNFMATGDDFGMVKLFQYPSPTEFAKFKVYPGHSAHVTNVRFTRGDSHLISVGGGDTSIFQWKVNEAQVDPARVEEHYDSDIEKEKEVRYKPRSDMIANATTEAEPSAPSDDNGDGFGIKLATADTLKAAKQSREYEMEYHSENLASHNRSLSLTYVHGFRGHDCRNNLFAVSDNEIAYHVAAAGVILDTATNTQRFFLEHTDDIVSLAYHPGMKVIATGQVGKNPQICIWNPKTMKCLSTLRGPHRLAVCALSFSKSGDHLVSVDESEDHTIAVWKWKEGTLMTTQKGSKEKIFDIVFNNFKDSLEFVSVGVKHVKFWKVAGTAIEEKKGIFGKEATIQTILSAVFASDKMCYTGTISGDIYEWTNNECTKVLKGHTGPVHSLVGPLNNGLMFSGGKDQNVLCWTSNFASIKEKIAIPKSSEEGSVPITKAITMYSNGTIFVGTSTSEIYEVTSGKAKLAMKGHADGELWGLATHPQRGFFATAGDDGSVAVWDIGKRTLVSRATVGPARSVAFSPSGKQLAVGLSNGGFAVLNAETLQEITKKRNRKEAIHEIKYSPDGKWLAVGSHDNFVDIYDTSSWKPVGVCKGNSSYITHLDWTTDSRYLHTNSGAYEHLMYDASGKQVVDRKLVQKLHDSKQWASWTGVLGDSLHGIWPAYSDKTDINALDTNKGQDCVVTGDDFGFVKVFAYPCTQKGAEHKKYVGHSAHVTNVRFSYDDSHLISVGGGDRSIFVWKFE